MVRQICTIANSHLTITGPARGFSIYNPFLTFKEYMFHIICLPFLISQGSIGLSGKVGGIPVPSSSVWNWHQISLLDFGCSCVRPLCLA